jgi:hypothetical protein
MGDGTLLSGTGEGDTVFVFGAVLGAALGQVVLQGGRVLGYDNPRERAYRIDGDRLEFIDGTGRVTSRLHRIPGPQVGYRGSSTDSPTPLHLTALVRVSRSDARGLPTGRILVNTVPKAGTYWLRKAFNHLGFVSTDLHLIGASMVVDNRGLAESPAMHSHVQDRTLEVDLRLLSLVLPAGSVTVGHIEHREVQQGIRESGLAVLNVTRALPDVLESLFAFKRDVVAPFDGERWRDLPSLVGQVLGFTAAYAAQDIAHVCAIRAMLEVEKGMPVLHYEDLVQGRLPAPQRQRLRGELGSRRAVTSLMNAVAQTRGTSTSTLSARQEQPELRSLMEQLASAIDG